MRTGRVPGAWRATQRLAAMGLAALVAACSPMGLAVEVAGLGSEDRSGPDQARDAEIRMSMNRGLISTDERLFKAVGVQVWEGRVILSGAVANPNDHQRVLAMAKGIPGVKMVYDEVKVTDSGGLSAFVTDTVIEERLKARLLAADGVRAANYSVRAVKGVVYLLGVAHSEAELERVLQETRTIESVERVVSYVHVRPAPPDRE